MQQRWKLFLLTALMLVLVILITRHSLIIIHNIKQVHAPTPQTRQSDALQIHHWTTVKELAQKYRMSQNEVFNYLEIKPQPGDEKLTLRRLRKKYHKTPEEMQINLNNLAINYTRKHGMNQ